ncbi:hypothetical protein P9209_26920 [Prescottella defluvii]|nr:hypothetical protein P9209_26920 [Prescottella defluvii]
MAGRHSAPRAKTVSPVVKYGSIGLAAVVVVGAGYFVVDSLTGGGCESTTAYTVAADPSIAPVLTEVTTAMSADDRGCRSFTVQAASGVDALGAPGSRAARTCGSRTPPSGSPRRAADRAPCSTSRHRRSPPPRS